MVYAHSYSDGRPVGLDAGKVVCVGRNYLEHVRELGNDVPEEPVLFMKPSTALVGLDRPLVLPVGQGSCHHEVEMAILVGERLRQATPAQARAAVAGYAVALDLTLREVQNRLKSQGCPWELAKAFDGACPISGFLRPGELAEPEAADLSLAIDGEIRQRGNTRQMMRGPFELMAHISAHFTLLPGDVVLTGTPAGVGPLSAGDRLELRLGPDLHCTARVA